MLRISRLPGEPSALVRRAQDLLAAGRADPATDILKRALTQTPKDPNAHTLAAVLLLRRGEAMAALQALSRAVAAAPEIDVAWLNLARVARAARRWDDARRAYGEAARRSPRLAEAWRGLGETEFACRRWADARAAFAHALEIEPRHRPTLEAAARTAYNLGNLEGARALVERALAEPAPDGDALTRTLRRIRARVLSRLGAMDEAMAAYEGLLAEDPDDVATLVEFGLLHLHRRADHRAANVHLGRAAALAPDDVEVQAEYLWSLVNSRHDSEGDHIEAAHALALRLVDGKASLVPAASILMTVFRRTADFAALDRLWVRLGDRGKLYRAWAESGRVTALHGQLPSAAGADDKRELLDAHRAWGEAAARAAETQPIRRPSLRAGDRRRIRVGLLSSDLRDHPIGYFVLPLVLLHDRDRIALRCYSFYPGAPDAAQRLIASKVDAFHVVRAGSARDVAQAIAGEQLDVLIELGGSTHHNRLEVVAWKMAPVQASWLGYPHSAGLPTIDRIVVDPHLAPADPRLLLETPLCLPESWVVCARPGFPDVEVRPGLPQDRTGHVTFGTMNNPVKYGAALLDLWARVLAAVPNARFRFVRPEGGAAIFRRHVRAAFARNGIDPERIEFVAVRGRHMPHYNDIDIALDTAPQTGGTTTCEALWMGVPTVTLVGEAFHERLSFSNLSNAGFGDLCAQDPDGFVEAAVRGADDVTRRRAFRADPRAWIGAHPLGDARSWVRAFEDAVTTLLP